MPPDSASMFRAMVLAGCSLVGCDEPVAAPEPIPLEAPLEVPLETTEHVENTEDLAVELEEPEAADDVEPDPDLATAMTPADPTMATPRMRRPQKAEAPCPPGSERPTPPCFFIL